MTNQAQKEARELPRRERQLAKPKGRGYMAYLLLIVSVVYISDEVASSIGMQMQSVIAQVIFAPVFGQEFAVARMSMLTSVTMAASLLAMFYKPLSDRYGRKPFLVINTLFMGLSMVVVSVATSIPVYLLGAMIIAFFTPHDMQAVYILETTPPRHRAKIFSVIKAISTLGVMVIPLLRRALMPEGVEGWRLVYAVPSVVALIAAILALFFIRETDAFLIKRLEYLRTDPARRDAAKQAKQVEQGQGGLVAAMRYCFRHRQLRWLLIAGSFLMWGFLMPMYYEATMTHGYAAPFLAQGMALEAAKTAAMPLVTQALFLFPVGCALPQLAHGFLSDKWGRKPTVIIMALCAVGGFLLFYLGAGLGWIPWLVGLLCGAAVGSTWSTMDISGPIMCSESAPTNLRSSVLSVQPLLSGIFGGIVMAAGIVLVNIFGDAWAGTISLAVAAPGMLIGLAIIIIKVRETKHVNLREITGLEEG